MSRLPSIGFSGVQSGYREIEQGEDMARVFVSHSSKDAYFGSLLVELLRFHHLDTCGESFPAKYVGLSLTNRD